MKNALRLPLTRFLGKTLLFGYTCLAIGYSVCGPINERMRMTEAGSTEIRVAFFVVDALAALLIVFGQVKKGVTLLGVAGACVFATYSIGAPFTWLLFLAAMAFWDVAFISFVAWFETGLSQRASEFTVTQTPS